MKIVKGKKFSPPRWFVYGTGGVGKTTFAANAGCLVIQTEDGADSVGPDRTPRINSWEELNETLDWFLAENVNLGYKALAIDTLDSAEKLCWEFCCRTVKTEKGHTAKNIEEYAFKSGYNIALEQWRQLFEKLSKIRAKYNCEIVLTAHTKTKTFIDPRGYEYIRYVPDLHATVTALAKGWCDAMLFIGEALATSKEGTRKVGKSDGVRIAYTVETPAVEAKNRYGLPRTIELDYRKIREFAERNDDTVLVSLVEELRELASGTGFETRAEEKIASVKSPEEMRKVINSLTAAIAAKKEKEDGKTQ